MGQLPIDTARMRHTHRVMRTRAGQPAPRLGDATGQVTRGKGLASGPGSARDGPRGLSDKAVLLDLFCSAEVLKETISAKQCLKLENAPVGNQTNI